MVFQVLPGCGIRKAPNDDAELRVAGCAVTASTAAAASAVVVATTPAVAGGGASATVCYLNPQSAAIKVESISTLDRSICNSRAFKLDETIAWRARRDLQFNVQNTPILVKQIFNFIFFDVSRKVSHVD